MAYYTKVKGGVRAQIERSGIRLSKTLPTKAQAEAWAIPEEAAIMAGERNQFPRRTLREAVKRYQVEVTDKKAEKKPKVARADNLRFEAWLRDYPDLANKVFCEITGDDLAAWRDARRGFRPRQRWCHRAPRLRGTSARGLLLHVRFYALEWRGGAKYQCCWFLNKPAALIMA